VYDDAYDYLWYAERYKWTPAQVDELPAWLDGILPQMVNVLESVREAAHEKSMNEASRG
jgi:hypothetical protein